MCGDNDLQVELLLLVFVECVKLLLLLYRPSCKLLGISTKDMERFPSSIETIINPFSKRKLWLYSRVNVL